MWHLPVKMAGRKRTSILVVVLSLILASLSRKTGARLLLGPSKDGNGNTMLPTRVGYDVIKTRATEASSPCYGVSPVESTRLESKDKRISQVHGSKGHRTSGQAVLYSC